VVTEVERVRQTVELIDASDLAGVGPLLDASHASLRDDYEVSTQAVEQAVDRLKEAGALGARLHGGGFGGAVLGLFPPDGTPPEEAILVTPGPGARVTGTPG
jgi:galactokinase